MLMSILVMPGSSVPKSSKIFLNLGMMQYMMKPTISVATVITAHGINHGPLHFAFQALGTFLELGQTLQNDFQSPAGLPGFDHVDVQVVERLGLFGHRFGQRVPDFDIFDHIDQRVFERAGFGLAFQNSQASAESAGRHPAAWRAAG